MKCVSCSGLHVSGHVVRHPGGDVPRGISRHVRCLYGPPEARQMFFYSGRQAVVSEPQTLRGIRVLLVDESRFVRRLFTMMLGELGAVVTVAGDGSEAIRIVGAGRTFDVVIVDSLLPSVDGAELCDDLCTISSGATKPIVVLYTGSLRRYQLRHGRIPRSVDAFVLKDASGDGLVQKISQLLDARSARVSSPAIAAEV